MTSIELESAVQDFINEKFESEVKPHIHDWLKSHGFVKMEFSMGGALLTKENGDTILDDDVYESDNPEYKQFYNDYLGLIVYHRNQKGQSILYGVNFNIIVK